MGRIDRFFYSTYRSAYPSMQRRKNKFTIAGNVVMAAIVGSSIFGIDTTKATAYQLFTLLTALFIISFICSLFFRARFTVSRALPPLATAGEKLTYRITIHNRTKRKQGSLIIQEIPSFHYPDFAEFMTAREPGESERNRWDQKVKYHRFQWLMEQHTRASPKEHPLPVIGANSYLNAYLELEPKRRGHLELAGLSIKRIDPFGLFKSTIHLTKHDRILILPRRYPLPPIHLPGLQKHHAGGVTMASSVGNADEFRALREYRPGDPMRMLHWKSVAKTGELIIRENEDEYFVRHALILDTFSAQPYSHTFETAVSIAASFACTIRTQESMLDLIFVEDKAYCFSAGRGVDHTSKMLEILACVETCSDKTLLELFPLIRQHASVLSGCICILQSWDEDRQKLVRILAERNIPVKVIVVTDGNHPETDQPIHWIDVNDPQKGLALL